MSTRKHIFIIILLVVLSLCIYLYMLVTAQAHKAAIRVREIRTYKFVTPEWCFVFEDFENPGIIKLLEQEKIKELVKGADTEFEKVLLVKRWVREQLKDAVGGSPNIIWNAAEILELVRQKKMHALCGQYGVVFAQILTGLGVTVRYIDLCSPKLNTHFLTEIWSQDYKKWVIIDPFLDLYYEKNGKPLGVYELHQAYQNNDILNCKVICHDVKKQITRDELELYYKFGIVFRNDQLTHAPLVYYTVGKNTPEQGIQVHPTWDDFILRYTPQGPYDAEKYYNWEPDITVIKVKNLNYRRGLVTLEFHSLLGKLNDFTVFANNKVSYCQQEFVWELQKGGYNKLTVFPRHNETDTQTYIVVDY
ncbi:MAG: transglutaminase-like domain-containing protein [Candidatus Firestonebacteria bacterium]